MTGGTTVMGAKSDRSLMRARVRHAALAIGTIIIGLLVHRGGSMLAPGVCDVLGDALWACMIYWWISVVAPGARPSRRAAGAIAVCWIVELSQMLDIEALNGWRRTTLGHLVLGSDFDTRDLFAYTGGVFVAALLGRATVGRREAGTTKPLPSTRSD
jgi:hypothetical protein